MKTLPLVCVGLLALASQAMGSWMYIPPAILLDEAKVIVVGTVTAVDAEKGTGVVAVEEVLRGDEDMKEMKVRFSPTPKVEPAPPGAKRITMVQHSAKTSFREGQKGVWIGRWSAQYEDGAYSMIYPGLFRQDTDNVKKILAERDAAPWGEAVDGLAVRAFVDTEMTPTMPRVYVSVKNVSDEPLRLAEHRGYRPVSVVVTDQDGEQKRPNIYGHRRLPAPQAHDFPVVQPGEVRYIWGGMGIPLGKLAGPMTYTISAAYEGKVTAENMKLRLDLGEAPLWTGRAGAPVVEIDVPDLDAPKPAAVEPG